MNLQCVGSRMDNGGRTLGAPMRRPAMVWSSILERGSSPTNRLSCGNQPAHIRLINRRHAVRSATNTLRNESKSKPYSIKT
jgi:hypothetical protein